MIAYRHGPKPQTRDPEPHGRAHAWLVRVKLNILAANLADRLGEPFEAGDAARWLVQRDRVAFDRAKSDQYRGNRPRDDESEFGEPSPFFPTDVPGTFYTEEDPAFWLEEEEIEFVRPIRIQGQQTKTAFAKPIKLRAMDNASHS